MKAVAFAPDGEMVAYGTARAYQPLMQSDSEQFTPRGVERQTVGNILAVADVRTGVSTGLGAPDATAWGASWSPDGQKLAFYSDQDGYARLWVWDRRTGRTTRVSSARIRVIFEYEVPRWTPDGAAVVVRVLPERFAEAQPSARREPRASPAPADVGTAKVRVLRSSPAEEAVTATSAATDTATTDSRIVPPGPSDLWAAGDLAAIDIRTGAVTQLSRGGFVMSWWVSPNGRRVAYTRRLGKRPYSSKTVAELVVADMAGGRRRVVVPQMPTVYGHVVAWSPSGKLLAYAIEFGSQERDSNPLFVVSAEGGPARAVAPGVPPIVAQSNDGTGMLRWTVSDATLVYDDVFSGVLWRVNVAQGTATRVLPSDSLRVRRILAVPADADSALLVQAATTATQTTGVYRIDVATGQFRPVSVAPLGLAIADISPRGDRIAFVGGEPAQPPDIWVGATQDPEHAKRVTDLNPMFNDYVYGPTRRVQWMSKNGWALRGRVILPAGYTPGRRYPLVTFVYPDGEEAIPAQTITSEAGESQVDHDTLLPPETGWGSLFNLQMLATRGYAVFLPSAPVRKGRQAEDLMADVMPGIDEVIRLGIADPARLGVWGHSGGGYATAVLIAGSPRFKAAIVGAGLANLLSGYFTDPTFFEVGQQGQGGTPWELFDRYVANSPIFRFDRVETPTFIYGGALDTAVRPEAGKEMFVALKRLGKTAEYVLYEGEGHSIQSPENVRDWWMRIIGWFDKYLSEPSSESKHE